MTRETLGAAPTIETERLLLRGYRLEDFAQVAAAWADPDVVRYIGRPSTEEESWARLLRNIALWPLLGYGYWAATEKSTGRYVGDVGFADFKRDIEPSIKGVPEIGWVLARWSHGQGYATESAQAVTPVSSEARLSRARRLHLGYPIHGSSHSIPGSSHKEHPVSCSS